MSRFFIVKVLYGPFLVGALSPICLIRPKDTAKIVLEVCFLSDLETQMLIQAWIFLEASLAWARWHIISLNQVTKNCSPELDGSTNGISITFLTTLIHWLPRNKQSRVSCCYSEPRQQQPAITQSFFFFHIHEGTSHATLCTTCWCFLVSRDQRIFFFLLVFSIQGQI